MDAPVGLCSEVTEQESRRLIHLVNYREDGPVRNVGVKLRVPHKVRQVALASPDQIEEIAVPFEQQDGVISFTVPEVVVYTIADVGFE